MSITGSVWIDKKEDNPDMITTHVLVLPSVLDLSLGITLDVMSAANRLQVARGGAPIFGFALVGPAGRRLTTGAGLQVGPVGALPPLPEPLSGSRPKAGATALVVVPGINLATVPEIQAWREQPAARRAARWLAGMVQGGAQVAAGCASTFLLGEAGLLQGRCATTTWWLAPHFRERFPGVELDMDRMVVADGAITTAGAALAQADLMLELVARHGSAELARQCARYLLLDRRTSQSRYALASHLVQQTPVMLRADRWIRQHLGGPITLAGLAEALHMTPRTVSRHFAVSAGVSPTRYIQRLAVGEAVLLLETGTEPLDAIAARVGYADATMLRRLMQRERGITPRMARNG